MVKQVPDYGDLGAFFESLGEYEKGKEYTEKALAIRKEIGDRKAEAVNYGSLGTLFRSLGEYEKAKEFTEKAPVIRKELGDRQGSATDYRNLGTLFYLLGKYDKAEEHLSKSIQVSKSIGDVMSEFKIVCSLTVLRLTQFNFQEAFSYLFQCIEKFEKLRDFVNLRRSPIMV